MKDNTIHTQGELKATKPCYIGGAHYNVALHTVDSDPNDPIIIAEKTLYSTGYARDKHQPDEDTIKRNFDRLAHCWNAYPALVEALQEIITHIDKQYEVDCGHANWHNNNTPGVGQRVAYMALPPYPKYATKAKELLNSLNK